MNLCAVLISATLFGQFGAEVGQNESAKPESGPARVRTAASAQTPSTGEQATAVVERPFHEINADIAATMRAEATAKSIAERFAAVEKLCQLHDELIGDSRRIDSPTLQEYRGKVYGRLVRVRRKLEQQQAREKRRAKGKLSPELEEFAATSQSLSDSLASVAATAGGPASMVMSEGRFGGGAVNAQADHGQLLIDLITTTIKPDHWEENGGPGSMFYYANFHALVVTASSEVHGRLGGVLDGLRRAGN